MRKNLLDSKKIKYMTIIKCKCGHEIEKEYANLFDINTWQWICIKCGQRYIEKIKKPIELTE